MKKSEKPVLTVRTARMEDIPAISRLERKVYPDMPRYSDEALIGQINNFPEGQFVAEYDGVIVGYAATICVSGAIALKPHTWRQVTGDGYCMTHNPSGDYLYGVDVFVDPGYRGLRIGQRLYQQRKKLCQHERLKGIIFAGRMPLLAKRIKRIDGAEKYLELVRQKKIKDPVLLFQIKEGFELIGVLKDYLPMDTESMGCAAHFVWHNPDIPSDEELKRSIGFSYEGSIRVATVQYMQRRIKSYEEFEQLVTYFVDVVADYKADFVLFPELFTLQLLAIDNKAIAPEEAIDRLTEYTERIVETFKVLAIEYNINIIAGSHPTKTAEGRIHNVTYVCLRDGSVHEQAKIHPTPNERFWWNIEGASKLQVINTDCGPIGVLICYDAEFPELARHLVNQGANILFVPFCTDERQSYLRVRYSAQARAVENQCYVVMSGNVGNLPNVHNMDIQYAQSCILTPCDFGFARDGIAADTTPNSETVAIADLRIDSLLQGRNSGTVRNLKDRRHDLYSVTWHGSNNP